MKTKTIGSWHRQIVLAQFVILMIFICSGAFKLYDVCSGAFKLYDVDNDGYITRNEMYNIVDAIYQMVVSLMSF